MTINYEIDADSSPFIEVSDDLIKDCRDETELRQILGQLALRDAREQISILVSRVDISEAVALMKAAQETSVEDEE